MLALWTGGVILRLRIIKVSVHVRLTVKDIEVCKGKAFDKVMFIIIAITFHHSSLFGSQEFPNRVLEFLSTRSSVF